MEVTLNNVQNIGNLELLAKQMVEGFITGLHKSPYHGFSVEFAEHRLYNNGESTRHIDWKIFAKTDRLYTKRYEEETNLRCQLVLDQSSSMFYPKENFGKMRFSVLAAAALSYLFHKQRDAVGLHTFSDRLEIETQVKSSASHMHQLMVHYNELLKKPEHRKRTRVSSILHELAQKVHRRSLVILFSDMFDNEENENELIAALQHLKHRKHEILLFHVTDHRTELDFEFEDRPYEFIDAETNEKLKLNPSNIKAEFRKKMDAYYQSLYLKCAQLKIDLITVDINQGFEQVLKAYLIKRKKMI